MLLSINKIRNQAIDPLGPSALGARRQMALVPLTGLGLDHELTLDVLRCCGPCRHGDDDVTMLRPTEK
jgi:hypothetical protein